MFGAVARPFGHPNKYVRATIFAFSDDTIYCVPVAERTHQKLEVIVGSDELTRSPMTSHSGMCATSRRSCSYGQARGL